jgi:hypothetical protein
MQIYAYPEPDRKQRLQLHLSRVHIISFCQRKPPRNACLISVMCQNLVKRANRKTVCYKDTVRARDPTPDNVSSSASSHLLIGQSLSGAGALSTNQSPRKARQKQRAHPTKETQDCDEQSSRPAL